MEYEALPNKKLNNDKTFCFKKKRSARASSIKCQLISHGIQ